MINTWFSKAPLIWLPPMVSRLETTTKVRRRERPQAAGGSWSTESQSTIAVRPILDRWRPGMGRLVQRKISCWRVLNWLLWWCWMQPEPVLCSRPAERARCCWTAVKRLEGGWDHPFLTTSSSSAQLLNHEGVSRLSRYKFCSRTWKQSEVFWVIFNDACSPLVGCVSWASIR